MELLWGTAEGSVRDVVGGETGEGGGISGGGYTPGPPHPSSPVARLLQRVIRLTLLHHPAIN